MEQAVENPPLTRPTRTRHWVVVFAATLSIITFVDRVCISQAKDDITRDLGLSDSQMGWVLSAFIIAYGIFEIPGGWLGDKIGPRKVLMRVVIMWSFFTAATGWAWNFGSMLVFRFLFGAGEAGCYPNLAKAFTNWLPTNERRRAASVMWLSARWGGAITPLLVVWIIGLVGWRRSFEIFAVIGVVWAFIFYWWFRDSPKDHPGVNEAELAMLPHGEAHASAHSNVPWKKLFESRTFWLLLFQYACFGYGWYFYITWLPTYLKEARGMELQKGALLAGIPLFFGGIGCITSAWLATALTKRGFDLAKIRRGITIFGFAGSAVMLLLSPYIANPVLAMLAMGLASFSLDLALIMCWDTCMHIGGSFAGTVSGAMNMAGQIGGAIGPVAVGYILQYMDRNWMLVFWISAAIYIVGGLCWLWIDPVRVIAGKTEPE